MGMAAYTSSVRKKEICIRKVLGSDSWTVLLLLWREYIGLILIASAIAIPLAWYFTNAWLTNFSLRITLSPWLFVVPVLLLLVTTLITVAFQTIKAAWTNPVEGIHHD